MTDAELANPLQTVLDRLENRLDRQDATLAEIQRAMGTDAADRTELRALLDESASDRRAIHNELTSERRERERLVKEAQMYREATDTRLAAVEARDSIAEIKDAIRLQLTLHRWWMTHKVRVRLSGAAMFIVALYGKELVTFTWRVLLARLGWQ